MRSISVGHSLLLCGLVLLCSAIPAAAQELVGTWGDPARIVIEGAKQYPADEIRRALATDIQAIAAGHPSAPLADYPQVLADRVLEGYLADGFALAKVTARLDTDEKKIVLTVEEGPQYRAGEIQVKGAKAIDAAKLVAWLTHKQPKPGAHLAGFMHEGGELVARWLDQNGEKVPLEKAVWTSGQSTTLAKDGKKARNNGIYQALEQQGYRQAKFDASVVRDESNHTAALVITIEDEGAPTRIERIEVTGSDRDTPADVISFLGVSVGQIVTWADRAGWSHKLWTSGRYCSQRVSIFTPKAPGDLTTLKIQLIDYDHASPLRGPLSTEEQVMLKHRDWLLGAINRGDALIVRGKLERRSFEFVTVKDTGALLFLDAEPAKDGGKSEPETSETIGPMLVVATPGEILHAYSGGEHLLHAPIGRSQVSLSGECWFGFYSGNTEPGGLLTIESGFTYKPGAVPPSPITVSLKVHPVAMLGMLHDAEQKVITPDGALILESETLKQTIEMATGRLQELWMQLDEDSTPVTISLEQRPFDEYLAAAKGKLTPASLTKPNAFDALRPMSSSVGFFVGSPLFRIAMKSYCGETKESPDPAATARVVKKLLDGDLLRPFDQWIIHSKSANEATFKIPDEENSYQVDVRERWAFSPDMKKLVGSFVLRHCNQTFSPGTWAWTLSRCIALDMMKKDRFYDSDLFSIFGSKEMGPIGRLFTAMLIEADNPRIAFIFASSGRSMLDINEFREEYRSLLDSNSLASEFLMHVAKTLGECDDNEAAELGRLLLDKDGRILVIAAKYMRDHKTEPIGKSLPALLDHLWVNGLSNIVESRLTAIYERHALEVLGTETVQDSTPQNRAAGNSSHSASQARASTEASDRSFRLSPMRRITRIQIQGTRLGSRFRALRR